MISIRDHQPFIEKYLPDTQEQLDRETEFCFYTWAPGRSLLESEEGLASQSFECGGQKWKLLFYPLGHPSLGFTAEQDAMSIYLARDTPESTSGKQASSDSHFALVVSLHDDPEVYITTHGYHKFTKDDSDYGFTYFDAKKRLLAHHAVVSETPLEVSVFLRVFKESELPHEVRKKKKSVVPSDDPPVKRLSVKDGKWRFFPPVFCLVNVYASNLAAAFVAAKLNVPHRDFQSYTLRIEKWSEVKEDSRVLGEFFNCGGYK
ncbi:ubiquitin-specific protease ubp15, partial [Marasmius tenuissimus]